MNIERRVVLVCPCLHSRIFVFWFSNPSQRILVKTVHVQFQDFDPMEDEFAPRISSKFTDLIDNIRQLSMRARNVQELIDQRVTRQGLLDHQEIDYLIGQIDTLRGRIRLLHEKTVKTIESARMRHRREVAEAEAEARAEAEAWAEAEARAEAKARAEAQAETEAEDESEDGDLSTSDPDSVADE